MSYSGLGITTSGTNTILDRGADVLALQQRLVSQGEIQASYADGVVSAVTSPTLRAVQASATAMGLPTSSVTRTSGGGLQLPTTLYRTLMGAIAETARSGDEWVSDVVKQAASKVTGQSTDASGYSPMFIWLATGTALLVVGSMALYAGRRSRRRSSMAPRPGSTLVPTPRTVVERRSQRLTAPERGFALAATEPRISRASTPTGRRMSRRRRS